MSCVKLGWDWLRELWDIVIKRLDECLDLAYCTYLLIYWIDEFIIKKVHWQSFYVFKELAMTMKNDEIFKASKKGLCTYSQSFTYNMSFKIYM